MDYQNSGSEFDDILNDNDGIDMIIDLIEDPCRSPPISLEALRNKIRDGIIEKIDGFDYEAGRYWVYPIDRELRDYQYCIVHNSLFNNTLVVLPTGLGKTFIAAVVMYNFYLWYPQSKLIFMAPTRPLVKQQIDACNEIVAVPTDDIVELTGQTIPTKRKEEWQNKRLFFLTPQVMQNDLYNNFCPTKFIKCIVVDEAHRATGDYAYCKVIQEVYRNNKQFRVLALSATPGSDLFKIKQVIKNLNISKVEFRSEESLDVQRYTHHRKIEKIVVKLNNEIINYKNRLLSIIDKNMKVLQTRKAIETYDLNRLSSYHLLMLKKNFEQGASNLPSNVLNSIRFCFAIVISLVYSLQLLENHGLRAFYNHIKNPDAEKGEKQKNFNLLRALKSDLTLQSIITDLRKKFEFDGNASINKGVSETLVHSIPGHPKLVKLQEIVLDHFNSCQEQDTRIMIFSQYRDSVEEIAAILRQHQPTVRPMMFVGQSSVKRKGFSQKTQLEVVKKFREGDFNTLIATCVAEEGLDIGNVDLIICYDTSRSPVRLVQRIGRTGRKREGKIIILVTEGKEEKTYKDSVYNKRRVADNLLCGLKKSDFFQNNPRLVPEKLNPCCRKMHLYNKYKEKNEENESEKKEEDEKLNLTSKKKKIKNNSNSNFELKEKTKKSKASKQSEEIRSEAKDEKIKTVELKTRNLKIFKQEETIKELEKEEKTEALALKVTKKKVEKIKYEPLISLNYVNKALKRKEAMDNLFGVKRNKTESKFEDSKEIEVISTAKTETIFKGYLSCNITIRNDFKSQNSKFLFRRLNCKFISLFIQLSKDNQINDKTLIENDLMKEIKDDFGNRVSQDILMSSIESEKTLPKEEENDEYSDFFINDEDDNFLATFNPLLNNEVTEDKSALENSRYSLESVIRMINTPLKDSNDNFTS